MQHIYGSCALSLNGPEIKRIFRTTLFAAASAGLVVIAQNLFVLNDLGIYGPMLVAILTPLIEAAQKYLMDNRQVPIGG